jgi:hypothetical protein
MPLRRQMKYDINILNGLFQALFSRDISPEKFHPIRQTPRLGGGARKRTNGISLLKKPFYEIRSDASGGTGDQYFLLHIKPIILGSSPK